MGRKPNQLILEFFERGQKLDDASNRYSYTCKSCGEKFPKGRVDSLTTHLAKRCPMLNVRDRQRAIMQLHDLPDLPAQDSNHNPIQNPDGSVDGVSASSAPPHQEPTALETLAEVSRRHLELSGTFNGKVPAPRAAKPIANHEVDAGQHQNLLDDFLVNDEHPSEPTTNESASHTHEAPSLPPIFPFSAGSTSSPGSPHIAGLPISQPSSSAQDLASSNLVATASAANQLLPSSNVAIDPEISGAETGITTDPQHDTQFRSSKWTTLQSALVDSIVEKNNVRSTPNKSRTRWKTPNTPDSANNKTHFTQDFSMNAKPAKPKVRGRFTDPRRREVQDIRKIGACLRCRMLKKPCSSEQPCNACANVETARLWKAPCIRTRVAAEFTLYAAGLHTITAFQAFSSTKLRHNVGRVFGRIEATAFPALGVFATFSPLEEQRSVDDSQLGDGNDGTATDGFARDSPASSTHPLIMLDSELDDISGKLDLYYKRLLNPFMEGNTPPSPFMKATLTFTGMYATESTDGLATLALELWVLTCLLTDRSIPWVFCHDPEKAPTSIPSSIAGSQNHGTPVDGETSPKRRQINPDTEPETFDIILMQILGSVEKRAAAIAQHIMHELERRLLQRQQAKPFETFLLSIMMLSCAERMLWLYKLWEEGRPPRPYAKTDSTRSEDKGKKRTYDESEHSSELNANANLTTVDPTLSHSPAAAQNQNVDPLLHPNWPLEPPPFVFTVQGERFSDILIMLLKMRAIPPRCHIDENGVVALAPMELVGDGKAHRYFQEIGLTNEVLSERTQDVKSFYGEGVGAHEFELRYSGRVVLACLNQN